MIRQAGINLGIVAGWAAAAYLFYRLTGLDPFRWTGFAMLAAAVGFTVWGRRTRNSNGYAFAFLAVCFGGLLVFQR